MASHPSSIVKFLANALAPNISPPKYTASAPAQITLLKISRFPAGDSNSNSCILIVPLFSHPFTISCQRLSNNFEQARCIFLVAITKRTVCTVLIYPLLYHQVMHLQVMPLILIFGRAIPAYPLLMH